MCGRGSWGEGEGFTWAVQLTGERRWQIGGRGLGFAMSLGCVTTTAETAAAAANTAGHLTRAAGRWGLGAGGEGSDTTRGRTRFGTEGGYSVVEGGLSFYAGGVRLQPSHVPLCSRCRRHRPLPLRVCLVVYRGGVVVASCGVCGGGVRELAVKS